MLHSNESKRIHCQSRSAARSQTNAYYRSQTIEDTGKGVKSKIDFHKSLLPVSATVCDRLIPYQ
jgi:hypothetical protein